MSWDSVSRLLMERGERRVPECLVFGRAALCRRIGEARVKEVEAWTKFPGQRMTRRATWDCYLHAVSGDSYVVATLDPDTVRKMQYANWPAVESAVNWALMLGKGGSPLRPTHITLAALTPPPANLDPAILGLDTEGADRIERVSLALGDWACSVPWDAPGKALTKRLIGEASTVLLWNAPHDMGLLEAEGIEIEIQKVRDLMVAHTVLNPWRERGLGKAAPLYIPVEPWKHSADMEWYSAMDAWVLLPLWQAIESLLAERKMGDLFLRDQDIAFRTHHLSAKPRWGKCENTVTKAAGLLEG